MAKLTFYRQKRFDGAVRTGIDLDDRTIAHQFEEGTGERDPALLWYVDLRCSGPGVPDTEDAALDWLVERSETIRRGFATFAEKMRAGADPDVYSLTWDEFDDKPPDVEMAIACSAVRRVDAREMSAILADVGARWDELIRQLGVAQEAEDLR